MNRLTIFLLGLCFFLGLGCLCLSFALTVIANSIPASAPVVSPAAPGLDANGIPRNEPIIPLQPEPGRGFD